MRTQPSATLEGAANLEAEAHQCEANDPIASISLLIQASREFRLLGRRDGAVRCMFWADHTAREHPCQQPAIHHERAWIYHEQGRLSKARVEILAALNGYRALQSSDATALLDLGQLLLLNDLAGIGKKAVGLFAQGLRR